MLKHAPILFLPLILLLLPCGLMAQTLLYKCPCVDSVSVNRGSNTWSMRDNRIRAYRNPPGFDIHGLMRFDLTKVPDTAMIFCARLVTPREIAFGSPKSNPVVDVYYSKDDNWTRANASPKSAIPTAVMAQHVIELTPNTIVWHLDLAAHNFKADLTDNMATLAIRNVNPLYSYFYLIGHTGSPTGPPPYLEISLFPGPFKHTTLGKGCPDSGNTVASIACREGVVGLGKPLPLNVYVSPTLSLSAMVTMGKYATSWGGLPLPFSIGFLGAKGCSINCSIETILPPLQMPVGGVAYEPLVPNDPVLHGAHIFFQAIIMDPKANPLGVITTNGVQVILW